MRSTASRPFLAEGDWVGVVAPGFAVRPAALREGVTALGRLGLRVRLGDHVAARHGYFAGTDAERARDLRAMLERREVRAVWFARGGFGTSRLLDAIPWARLREDPKLLIGYSDLTALFAPAIDRAAAPCLYGPVVTELADGGAFHAPSLRAALRGEPYELRFTARQVLVGGRARGALAGGNLTVLAHLCGTRWMPDLDGRILFLEEVGEETYRVDRLLVQLRSAGAFDRLGGVVLGSLAGPRRTAFPPERRLADVVRETFVPLGVPVVTGLRAGHVRHKRTLALGATAELDTRARTLRFAV